MIFFLPIRTGEGTGCVDFYQEQFDTLKLLLSISVVSFCLLSIVHYFGGKYEDILSVVPFAIFAMSASGSVLMIIMFLGSLILEAITAIIKTIFPKQPYVSAPREEDGYYSRRLGGQDFTINWDAIKANTQEVVDKINKLEDEKPITIDGNESSGNIKIRSTI